MLPEEPAILEVRHAVRAWVAAHASGRELVVALSGGADSLALTAAAAAEAESVHALVVDHGLQEGSGAVAATAAEQALVLGCDSADIVAVEVGVRGGMEAAARSARYEALDAHRRGRCVLLGHTLDDQAETVLLGLARGSGGRSIRGMSPFTPPWGRPLLGVRRAVTHRACAELGLEPHEDPHNSSLDFTRVRLRAEVLPLLEDVLGGGVAEALSRTGAQLREDGAVLDAVADDVGSRVVIGTEVDVATLVTEDVAIRRRVLRNWLHGRGAQRLTDKQLRAVDDLIGNWRGQGGVAVGGGNPNARLVVCRRHGRLRVGLEGTGPDDERRV